MVCGRVQWGVAAAIMVRLYPEVPSRSMAMGVTFDL
jgi:hypothetical protein